jgi:hypothetical protein
MCVELNVVYLIPMLSSAEISKELTLILFWKVEQPCVAATLISLKPCASIIFLYIISFLNFSSTNLVNEIF